MIELTNSRNDLKAERAKVESLKNKLSQYEVSNARIIEENEEEKKKLLKTIEEQNKQLEQMKFPLLLSLITILERMVLLDSGVFLKRKQKRKIK